MADEDAAASGSAPESQGAEEGVAATPASVPDAPEEIQEAIEEGEGSTKRIIQGLLAQFQQTGPAQHPLADKVKSEHIGRMLDLQERGADHTLEDRNEARRHIKFIFVSAGVFLLALVGLLLWGGETGQIGRILGIIFIAVSAAFGGWGYAQRG